MDVLVIGDCLLRKEDQAAETVAPEAHRVRFAPD
jgi:hypothetical protein